MIINIPKPEDFEKQSIQYLAQALNLIRDRDKEYIEEWLSEMGPEDHISKKQYWEYHRGILNNSLTLLFLSLENYLKKEICTVSPFMLIAEEPTKWRSRKTERPFSDLYILQFDDLLVLFQELDLGVITDQTATKLEELRRKRNQITHGVSDPNITPEYVLEIFYTIAIHIWGPRIWWDQFKSYMYNEPFFGVFNADFETASITYYVELLVSYIGKKKTGDVLGVNLKQRNYYCPYCQYNLNKDWDDSDSNYAILVPNKSDSNTLYCVVCDETHEVDRVKCVNKPCKGNVIGGDEYCLTCWCEQ